MTYTAEEDPLCYPGTTILRNKLDLRTQAELEEFETAMYVVRAEEPLPAGRLDSPHYLSLHRHFFQDVYDWAGQIRTIRIGKGGNWFCFPEYMESELNPVFENLRELNYLEGFDANGFSANAAQILAEINAVHPFREGNGRTQMVFLYLLTDNAGFPFNDNVLDDTEQVLSAMIESFEGSELPLERFAIT